MGHHNKKRNQYRHPKGGQSTPELSLKKGRSQSTDVGTKLKMMGLSKPKKKEKRKEQQNDSNLHPVRVGHHSTELDL